MRLKIEDAGKGKNNKINNVQYQKNIFLKGKNKNNGEFDDGHRQGVMINFSEYFFVYRRTTDMKQ
jgi:hypothetical protein